MKNQLKLFMDKNNNIKVKLSKIFLKKLMQVTLLEAIMTSNFKYRKN